MTGRTASLLTRITPAAEFIDRPVRRLAPIALTSALAGVLEAAAIAAVAQSAVLLASEGSDVASIPGLDQSIGVNGLLGAAAAAIACKLLLQIFQARSLASLTEHVQGSVRQRLFDAFLRARWPLKSTLVEGTMQELQTTYVDRTSSGVYLIGVAATAALNFAVLMLAAFALGPFVALGLAVSGALLFVLLRPLSSMARRFGSTYTDHHHRYAERVSELSRLAQEIETFGVADQVASGHAVASRQLGVTFRPTLVVSNLGPAAYQTLAMLGAVTALFAVQRLAATNLAGLGAVVLLILRALAYSQQLQAVHQQLRGLEPLAAKLKEVLASLQPSETPLERPVTHSIWSVEMEDVTFRYPNGTKALDGITVKIEATEAVGVVGPSGAGKSTLVQLLMRLQEPTGGQIRVGGELASDLDRASWARSVALVPQQPRLLNATVRENIRFFRPWISDDEIEQAAAAANIDREIVRWPAGYETPIGEQVDAISGGQRQRIAIARALAGSPELLVLDEPTSSLDAASEVAVQKALFGLRGSMTLVIVAHRLSTLNICDRILVLRDGVLDAEGTAASLESGNDFFREAVRLARLGPSGVLPS